MKSISRQEEIIGCLWLIMAFTALGAGCPKWVFILLFVKGVLDQLASIRHAAKEIREEELQSNDKDAHDAERR